ncbi:MAG: alpha/beta hydrolase, partial [Chloroflexota bacterium]
MNPSTTKAYYEGVPDKLVKPLLDFRADVPLQSATIGDTNWTYYTLGDPTAEPLLLLHGGGGNAGTMFQHIRGYANNFYVVAPNIPHNLTTISDVVVGLRALLGNLNITRANVVGMSFGAMLAQMYIRRFMDTVHNLVITHTMIPSQHMAEPMQMRVGMLTMYPEPLLLWMSKRSYFNDLPATTTPASPEKIAFWRAYFDELYSEQMTKRQIIARTKLTANYHVEYEFTGRDLKGWDGQL